MASKIIRSIKVIDKWFEATFPCCITQSITNALNDTTIFIDKDMWSILFRIFWLMLFPLVVIDIFLSWLFLIFWQVFRYIVLFILGEDT